MSWLARSIATSLNIPDDSAADDDPDAAVTHSAAASSPAPSPHTPSPPHQPLQSRARLGFVGGCSCIIEGQECQLLERPVAPFDMCYQASALTMTRLGYGVANIDLMLDGGQTWTLPGGSSLVQVNDQTVCFAFVQIEPSMPAAADSPAVILGGFQMENHLLMFDLEKETFAFSGLLFGIRTTCSNFNFTMGSS